MYTVIKCPELRDPDNGRVEVSGNTPGSTAIYRCNPPYMIVGTNTRTCQNNGEWSGRAPVCICKQLNMLVSELEAHATFNL